MAPSRAADHRSAPAGRQRMSGWARGSSWSASCRASCRVRQRVRGFSPPAGYTVTKAAPVSCKSGPRSSVTTAMDRRGMHRTAWGPKPHRRYRVLCSSSHQRAPCSSSQAARPSASSRAASCRSASARAGQSHWNSTGSSGARHKMTHRRKNSTAAAGCSRLMAAPPAMPGSGPGRRPPPAQAGAAACRGCAPRQAAARPGGPAGWTNRPPK